LKHANKSRTPAKTQANQTNPATPQSHIADATAKAPPGCPRISKPQTSAKQKKSRCESEYANQITNGLRHLLPEYATRPHSVYD
jgi:hypothetical protein